MKDNKKENKATPSPVKKSVSLSEFVDHTNKAVQAHNDILALLNNYYAVIPSAQREIIENGLNDIKEACLYFRGIQS